MFTVEQIKTAHARVKSGADFPTYIQDIKKLGVIRFETFVVDNHTDYYGANNYKTSSDPLPDFLPIATSSHVDQFKQDLKRHQSGETDYPAFLRDCAASGVEKWIVDLHAMTCTYYDLAGKEVVEEQIPG